MIGVKHVKRRARTAAGFTLVEVLVAVGIVALLYSLGAVSLKSVSGHQAVKSTASQLAEDIRWIQLRAAGEGKPWRMTIDQVASTYRMEQATDCDASGFTLWKERALPAGVMIVQVSDPITPVEILYSCQGRRDYWPLELEVTADDGYKQIVTALGWAGVQVR